MIETGAMLGHPIERQRKRQNTRTDPWVPYIVDVSAGFDWSTYRYRFRSKLASQLAHGGTVTGRWAGEVLARFREQSLLHSIYQQARSNGKVGTKVHIDLESTYVPQA